MVLLIRKLIENVLKVIISNFFQNKNVFSRGDYCIVRLIPLFEKTKKSFTSNIRSVQKNKSRPFIVIDSKNETLKMIFLTTYFLVRKYRPKIQTGKCSIEKNRHDCFGLDLRRKYTWVYKDNGRHGYFYNLNIHLLEELYDEGLLKKCGHCSEQVVEEFLDNIKSFSRGRR